MRTSTQRGQGVVGRMVLLMMLGWCCVGMGGCTAVRMMGMQQRGQKETPVPEGGRISSIQADGRIVPSVLVVVESPLTARETVAWYRETLRRQGWVIAEESWDETADKTYYKTWRETPWKGKEELELRVDEHESGAMARVYITGEYTWDLPSRVLVRLLHSSEGAAYPLGYSLHMIKNGDPGERMLMLLVGLPTALAIQALCIPSDILWWTI